MRILSIGKIAEYHGVSKSTIYRWLKAGKITENYRTYGNHRRFIVENNQDKIVLYSMGVINITKNRFKSPIRKTHVTAKITIQINLINLSNI